MLVEYRKAVKTGFPTDGLMILVGNPKSGKTTLASAFPDSYVLELERGGADRVDGRIDNVSSLADFRKKLKAAVEEKSVGTIVVDTIDVLSDWLELEIAQKYGLQKMNDSKQGVNGYEKWGDYRDKVETLVDYFKACGKLIVLIAHCKEPKVLEDQVVTPAGINMPGKAGNYIAAQADLIGYVYKKPVGSTTHFYVTFSGGPLGVWGSRIKELNNKTLQFTESDPFACFKEVFKPLGGK